MKMPSLALRRAPDFTAIFMVLGALGLAAFLGLVTSYLPWIFTLLLVLLPLVLLASISRPMIGLVVVLMFVFEAIPTAFQPRLPFGGGRLQATDVLLIYLGFLVLLRAWMTGQPPLRSMGPLRFPLYYVYTCIGVSLVYVRYFAPNTVALGEARVFIGWLIVPIMVLAADTPQRFRWMLRSVVGIGLVIALYVTIQSLFDIRIMTSARVEALNLDLSSGVTRSIAGGGIYIVIFTLYLLINRMLDRTVSWLWAAPAALLLVMGIAVQFGRGVWLASVLGFLVSAALFRGVIGLFRALALGALTVALVLGVASVTKPRLAEAVIERATGIGSEIKTGGSFNWRRLENDAALLRIERSPLTGTGLGGQYKQTSSSVGHFGIETTYIHNAYLFFPLKMGLFAAFVPLAFIIAFAMTLRQGVKRHREQADPAFVAALAGGFATPCLTSFTQPEFADPRGIAAFAIFCGLALLFRRFGAVTLRPAAAAPPPPRPR